MSFDRNELKWLSSYLDNREHITIGNNVSSIVVDDSGIPQDIVLGPFPFALHINDIVKSGMCGATISLFADGTLLYVEDVPVIRAAER